MIFTSSIEAAIIQDHVINDLLANELAYSRAHNDSSVFYHVSHVIHQKLKADFRGMREIVSLHDKIDKNQSSYC